jgi:hypothetical protein
MFGFFLVAFMGASSSFLSPEFSFNEFCDTPFFTALELFLVSIAGQVVLQIISHSTTFQATSIIKKNTAVFLRTKHWLKRINRYSSPGLDVRRSWTIKRSEEEFKSDTVMPTNPMLMMLPFIANLGPSVLANWVLSDRPALRLPFDIPGPLQKLFQYGLPQRIADDHRIVGAFGFSFLLNFCSAAIAGVLPMAQKRAKVYGPKDNYKNFSDLLVSEQHHWELEGAEDELLAVIDQAAAH